MRIWIKNPLAILAEGAEGGVVCEGAKIVECIASGGEPTQAVDQVFDASAHVVLPGLINTHHHFYQTMTRGPPVSDQQGAVSLAQSALSDLGKERKPGLVSSGDTAGADRVDDERLHNRFRPSLFVSRRA